MGSASSDPRAVPAAAEVRFGVDLWLNGGIVAEGVPCIAVLARDRPEVAELLVVTLHDRGEVREPLDEEDPNPIAQALIKAAWSRLSTAEGEIAAVWEQWAAPSGLAREPQPSPFPRPTRKTLIPRPVTT